MPRMRGRVHWAEPDSRGVALPRVATRAPPAFPSAGGIADLLVTVIKGVAGRTERDWRKAVGQIERLPTSRYVIHHWRAAPAGSPAERDLVERAVAVVRAEHPYIA